MCFTIAIHKESECDNLSNKFSLTCVTIANNVGFDFSCGFIFFNVADSLQPYDLFTTDDLFWWYHPTFYWLKNEKMKKM